MPEPDDDELDGLLARVAKNPEACLSGSIPPAVVDVLRELAWACYYYRRYGYSDFIVGEFPKIDGQLEALLRNRIQP